MGRGTHTHTRNVHTCTLTRTLRRLSFIRIYVLYQWFLGARMCRPSAGGAGSNDSHAPQWKSSVAHREWAVCGGCGGGEGARARCACLGFTVRVGGVATMVRRSRRTDGTRSRAFTCARRRRNGMMLQSSYARVHPDCVLCVCCAPCVHARVSVVVCCALLYENWIEVGTVVQMLDSQVCIVRSTLRNAFVMQRRRLSSTVQTQETIHQSPTRPPRPYPNGTTM